MGDIEAYRLRASPIAGKIKRATLKGHIQTGAEVIENSSNLGGISNGTVIQNQTLDLVGCPGTGLFVWEAD